MTLELYVAVTDMNRAVAFYTQVFGAAPIQRSERYSAFDIAGTRFGLFNAAFYSHPLTVGNNCIPNLRVTNIEAEFERIKPLASKITDAVQNAGPFRLFMFADPDGNVLEFYQVGQ